LATYQTTLARHTEGASSEYLLGEIVSGNFFELMGIRAILGRALEPSDDVSPGGHPVVVVSERFWRGRLGGRPDIIGGLLDLNGRPYAIVGVLPSAYAGGVPGVGMQFWAPVAMVDHLNPSAREGTSRLERRTSRGVRVRARLQPGATVETAQAQLDSVLTRLRERFPDDYRERTAHLLPSRDVRIHPLVDSALYPAAAVLMAVVGLVLFIACANLANMLLARATARRGEVALRLALGASRLRLLRQLLCESVLLSGLGGALGLGVADVGTRVLLSLRPPLPFPLALDLTLNHRVLLFTLAVSVSAGILFGIAPALQSARTSLVSGLKPESVVSLGGRRLNLRSLLVVVQVAASLVLLIGAGLLLKSAANAKGIDPGFETERMVMFSSHLGLHGYDEARGKEFYRRAVERLSEHPALEAASITDKVPLGASVQTENVAPEGKEPDRPGDWPEIDSATISPGYFQTMGIAIREGRDFEWGDDERSRRVVIVNEAAARKLWPGENALGKRLARGSGTDREYAEVIGLVPDTKVRTLGEETRPHVYYPFAQNYSPMMYVLARTRGNPDPVLEPVRRELLSMDASLAFFEAKTMPQNLAITLFPVRLGALLLAVFGGLALVLASTGLYGVVSYSVSRRTREIGIRMALGAGRRDIEGLITRQGAGLVAAGVLVGWLAAILLARALSAVLYGVEPTDAATFLGTAALLAVVALAANWLPARRAARGKPIVALRYE
jgi:putative ABC transport system permease protein